MPCAETERRLHAYFDGELDALGAAAFESHLETCAECRAALEDLKAMRSALRAELPYERAPAALAARITAALDRETAALGSRDAVARRAEATCRAMVPAAACSPARAAGCSRRPWPFSSSRRTSLPRARRCSTISSMRTSARSCPRISSMSNRPIGTL